MSAHFKSEIRGSVLWITFSHPTQSSSFSYEEALALKAILKNRPELDYKAIVFQGDLQQRVFCAGGNLLAYSALRRRSQGIRINRKIKTVLEEFSQAPVPTLCLVTGDCLGGGIELISAFDHIISVTHAAFGFWQRRAGLSLGWGGGGRLQKRMRSQAVLTSLATGELLSSGQALDVGLIDAVVPEHFLMDRAQEWLTRVLRNQDVPPLKDLGMETRWFERLWWAPAHRERLSQFRNKSN